MYIYASRKCQTSDHFTCTHDGKSIKCRDEVEVVVMSTYVPTSYFPLPMSHFHRLLPSTSLRVVPRSPSFPHLPVCICCGLKTDMARCSKSKHMTFYYSSEVSSHRVKSFLGNENALFVCLFVL